MVTRLAVIAAAVAFLSCAAKASAGTYTVTGCRTGWVPDVRNTTDAFGPGVFDQCAQQNADWLYASLGARFAPNLGDYASWRFDAPSATTIAAVTVTWHGRGDDEGADYASSVIGLVASNSAQPFERDDTFAETRTMSVPDAQWVQAYVACKAFNPSLTRCRAPIQGPNEPPESAHFAITRSTVTLVDRFAPEIQQAGGAALTDPVWTGVEQLSFRAEDKGGGLYRGLVEVDGAVARALPATRDERCIDQTGNRDFAYAVPCPTAGGGSVQIDTSGLPEGPHVVGVYVEDVADNRTALMPPARIRIVNDLQALGYFSRGQFFNPRFASPRTLNGDRATSGAKLSAAFVRRVGRGRSRHNVRRATREVRYSQGATVKGTLTTPSGEPISDATVFVGQQPEGQQWRIEGTVRTDTRGRFVYRPAARHPNRRLRAVYFPFSDSHENATSGVLTLKVRAGMTLHVNRHMLRNGERLIFTGRVLGPVPAAGIAVTLQAKVGRHYRSFRQLRATSRTNGRIRTVYRFERTTRPARYRFRLKVVRQAGLPFQSGVSPVVSVSVRP
jgi:hypothetical protein